MNDHVIFFLSLYHLHNDGLDIIECQSHIKQQPVCFIQCWVWVFITTLPLSKKKSFMYMTNVYQNAWEAAFLRHNITLFSSVWNVFMFFFFCFFFNLSHSRELVVRYSSFPAVFTSVHNLIFFFSPLVRPCQNCEL